MQNQGGGDHTIRENLFFLQFLLLLLLLWNARYVIYQLIIKDCWRFLCTRSCLKQISISNPTTSTVSSHSSFFGPNGRIETVRWLIYQPAAIANAFRRWSPLVVVDPKQETFPVIDPGGGGGGCCWKMRGMTSWYICPSIILRVGNLTAVTSAGMAFCSGGDRSDQQAL